MKIYSFRPQEKLQNETKGVINLPLVSIIPLFPEKPDISKYDSIAFLSSIAAQCFFSNMHLQIPDSLKVFAVGPKTANEIPVNRRSIIIPAEHDANSLAVKLRESGVKSLLLPRGSEHTSTFVQSLESSEITVKEINVYSYGKGSGQDILRNLDLDAEPSVLLFTSSMEVRIFHSVTDGKFLSAITVPFGKPTMETLRTMGYKRMVAGKFTDFQSAIEYILKNSGEWI